jgi:hypothetical protein
LCWNTCALRTVVLVAVTASPRSAPIRRAMSLSVTPT